MHCKPKSLALLIGISFIVYLMYFECATPPLQSEINVSDAFWQVTDTSNGTFYLFNAYYDDREALGNVSLVRVLSLINGLEPVVKMFCQLWFDNRDDAVVSRVIEYRALWPSQWAQNERGATPHLLSCRNPIDGVPKFVSLTEGRCVHANNLMEIKNKRPADGRKRDFLVSVKGLDFADDISMQLIEWCEILKILGVDKVEFFVVRVHVNVIKVLQFYQSQGFVTIKFLKYPHDLLNKRSENHLQWSQNDLVAYHDSLYENLKLYEFMVPMDIDEFIVPVRPEDRTWNDLIERTAADFDSLTATNRYFLVKKFQENETLQGTPRQLKFLSNYYRAANFTPNDGNVKSFMRMNRVLSVHNHLPLSCVGDKKCRMLKIALDDGQLSHYKADCNTPECKESLEHPTKDTTLWKYREEILKGVNDTIGRLKDFDAS